MKARRRLVLIASLTSLMILACSGPQLQQHAFDEYLEAEQRSLLDAASEALPASLKEVYQLVMEGRSFKEMSEELGMKDGSVRQRYHRMKHELKRRLRKY